MGPRSSLGLRVLFTGHRTLCLNIARVDIGCLSFRPREHSVEIEYIWSIFGVYLEYIWRDEQGVSEGVLIRSLYKGSSLLAALL